MTKALLKKAAHYCERNKHRFTKPRQEVLRIILSSKKPIGAYDVLEELGKSIENPKPPTAYRAIEFWQKHGFIHRIESLNTYTACMAGHQHKGSQFMICNSCGHVTETHLCDLPNALQKSIAKNSFTASSWNFEIHGTCSKCV